MSIIPVTFITCTDRLTRLVSDYPDIDRLNVKEYLVCTNGRLKLVLFFSYIRRSLQNVLHHFDILLIYYDNKKCLT